MYVHIQNIFLALVSMDMHFTAYQWHTLFPLCLHVQNELTYVYMHTLSRSVFTLRYRILRPAPAKLQRWVQPCPLKRSRTHSRFSVMDWFENSTISASRCTPILSERTHYPATKYHLLLSQGRPAPPLPTPKHTHALTDLCFGNSSSKNTTMFHVDIEP